MYDCGMHTSTLTCTMGVVIGWGTGGDCGLHGPKYKCNQEIQLREWKCRRWKVLFSVLHIFIGFKYDCLYLSLSAYSYGYASRRAYSSNLHSGWLRWCVRFVCSIAIHTPKWKLFPVILEIKFSDEHMFTYVSANSTSSWSFSFHPSIKAMTMVYARMCVCAVSMYCLKAFELCLARQTHFI